jgi:Zn-dependent protease/CBS domain-containing protein
MSGRPTGGGTMPVGRLAGVRIGIHWSWLIVFVLITWTLASGVFPSQNPGLSHADYVVMAAAAALLFFGTLLLHELGHALQARREQVEIEGITLWLFGGVARFKGDLPSAGAEFRIAMAGPLVTLVLGVGFAFVAAVASLPDSVDGVMAWLGYVNLTLLVFNMLPALPLDGGRVLRSLLWMRKGDLSQATMAAGGVARLLAYLLIGGGLAAFVFQGAFSGAWFAFIGWFLLQASEAEVQWVVAKHGLEGVTVRDLMTARPVSVPSELTLGRFVDDVVWSSRHTTYPVIDGQRPVGLLPFRRVAQIPRELWDSQTVGESMIPLEEVPILHENEPAAEALLALQQDGVSRGLVVEGGSLVGILSIADIAQALELRRLRGRSRVART